MPHLLISLIGEQPIPNLMPLWQIEDFTATQFIATGFTSAVANTMTEAIRLDEQLNRLQVLPLKSSKPITSGKPALLWLPSSPSTCWQAKMYA
jgi:hypothetical protein